MNTKTEAAPKKYIGGWSANNGSTHSSGYEYTSLRDAKKSLRAMCRGNVFAGNFGSWSVYDVNDTSEPVASGTVR